MVLLKISLLKLGSRTAASTRRILRSCGLSLLLAVGVTSSLQAAMFPCEVPNCPTGAYESFGPELQYVLPPTRSAVPPSLRDANLIFASDVNRIGAKSGDAKGVETPICGVNGMCASFPKEQTDVVAWIGFPYMDSQDFFVATFGQEAIHLGDGEYFTPFWDKRHFWIQVSGDGVPQGIQQRYVGTDPATGHDFYSADYVGYQQPGVDYSAYHFGMSISALILEVDSQGNLVDFFIELYDENDDYVEDVDLELGDQLLTFFFGFQQQDPTTITLLAIEDLTEITMEPEFFLAEWYPGTTFPCTHCAGLDLSQEQFYFMFEGLSLARWNYTEPKPITDTPVVNVPLGLPTRVALVLGLGLLGMLAIRRMS